MAAALVLRGTDAQLNFPNLASSLPRPHDLTDKSIQAAAIEAAQNFARQMRSHNRAFAAPSASSSRDPPIQLETAEESEAAAARVTSNHSLTAVEFESSGMQHDMEVDLMYSMREPMLHNSTVIDSDHEGAYNSYSWEPRLWSF